MSVQTLKEKKWGILGAMIGAMVFPILSYLLDVVAHLVRLIFGL
jgi:hypothetical protein